MHSHSGRATVRHVDDATLARLEHESMLDWLRITFAQPVGAEIRTEDGVGFFSTGLDHPFFNQIATDDGATPAALTRAVADMRARVRRHYVVLRRGRDERLGPVLADLGLARDDDRLPGMGLHPIPANRPDPPGFDVRVIEDDAGLEDHMAIAAEGFEMARPMVDAFIGPRLWEAPGCTVYVGYADGVPVTAGFAVRSGRAIGVYTIATVVSARGHGYGEAMTRRIVADGAAAGCDAAVLQASTMGRPIYERIGFRLVQEYDVYEG
jgi:ribosomal protein S18 acetylase RimI-like enzyme